MYHCSFKKPHFISHHVIFTLSTALVLFSSRERENQCKKKREEGRRRRDMMRNSIRCCISCILPCGSLDVIRIVHSNGRVEEISGTIKAIDVMKAHPKHILKKPCSTSSDGGDCGAPKIVIVPPEAELRRGKIYFLMPLPPPPSAEKNQQRRNKRKEHSERRNSYSYDSNSISMPSLLVSDRYLTEILSEKVSMPRDRRRGRVAVWRPHLESISESPFDL